MNNINIAEILKDCPKGTKLYSPLCGECSLYIVNTNFGSIIVETSTFKTLQFNIDGTYYDGYNEAECILFPSKENRDWSTFQRHFKVGDRIKNKYLTPNKFDISTLKPFDKVLARDCDSDKWIPTFFGYMDVTIPQYPFACVHDKYTQCIPYNDDTKHLLGTTNDCDEYYKTW